MGEMDTPELGETQPERDWILTRILWLSGTEPGFNRLGQCDTLRRYIYIPTSLHPYIHSTPDEAFEQARRALDSQPQLRAFVSADVAHLASARAASFSSDSNASQFVTGPTCANSTMPLRSRM